MRIFSIILLYIFSFSGYFTTALNASDIDQKISVDLGIDLSNYLSMAFDNKKKRHELLLRVSINDKFKLVTEGGLSNVTLSKYNYDYSAIGKYMKIGIEHDAVKNNEDAVFVGFRYGYSNFKREFLDITVNSMGDTYQTSIDPFSLNSHWLEGLVGMNVEIFENIFLGWTLRTKVYISNNKDPITKPLYIPGYGKKSTRLGTGFSYFILYRFGK